MLLEPFLRQLSGESALAIPKDGIKRKAVRERIGPVNLQYSSDISPA